MMIRISVCVDNLSKRWKIVLPVQFIIRVW